MPFQPILPTWLALNSCDDTSPSGFTDVRTGAALFAGGLNEGDYFDLTETEANNLSYTTNGTLHAGRYRRVHVDSGATQGYVKTGTIGYMVKGLQPKLNVVTSYDVGIVGVHCVVFLNAITKGNYGFVQELGIATVLCGATITNGVSASTGLVVNSAATGVVDIPSGQPSIWIPSTVGLSLDPAMPGSLMRVMMFGPALQG
jgi:hypothetical protein